MIPLVELRRRRAEMRAMSDEELVEWSAYLRVEAVADAPAASLRHSTREEIALTLNERRYWRERRARAALRGIPDPGLAACPDDLR